ncbi:MAG: N-acetylneuraminate synthase [Patescibacteria group bacterium]|jgi:N-acetylneuraminate synthase
MTTQTFRIGPATVGYGHPVFIIAEAGVNHNGRLDLALKLIDAAADAGADAVKFQTFHAEDVVTSQGEMAAYQKKNIGKVKSQIEMLRELELKDKDYPLLIARAKKRKILFLSTPHGGKNSVDFLRKLGIPAFKFGSGDLTNLPVIAYAASFGKPMILGTGMGTMKEVEDAIAVIQKAGNRKIAMLHCTSNYPCPPEETNLRAMTTMMENLPVLVGYSDHTAGIQIPIMVTAMGACVIEKHFTLDKNMAGPDHKASLEPDELRSMVEAVRLATTVLGSSKKAPNPSEKIIAPLVRKSLVTLKPIDKGEKFTHNNIGIKRPGTGIQPREYSRILGKTARRMIPADTLLRPHDIRP